MKFPRNARILRSQLDAAPFASVFFLLLLFLMLGALVPTPGLPLHLPDQGRSPTNGLPGLDKPSIAVAVDAFGNFYFGNTNVNAVDLRTRLHQAVEKSPEPLTLIIQADKSALHGQVVALELLARDAGIREVHEAVLPRPFNDGAPPRQP
jgi:biopolymer transport protein ExbD